MDRAEAQGSKADPNAASGTGDYPVQFSVEYPGSSSRLKTLFRLFLMIPTFLVLTLLSGDLGGLVEQSGPWWTGYLAPAGALWLGPLLMIVFRQKYPRWCFDTYLELYRFSARVTAYMILLRDEYPALDEEQAVRLQIEYPDVKCQLNRFLPIIKWLLVTPHLIILAILLIAALIATAIAWFAILVVGRYPRKLFAFVEGVLRWSARAWCYAFMLSTDRYPPFRLRA